jgi:NAD(P)-dependent dehydrogenase (short-subunit alcohol dehydrogenase family)
VVGTRSGGGSWTIPDKEWHENFALNLFAAMRLTNAVLPALRASHAASTTTRASRIETLGYGHDSGRWEPRKWPVAVYRTLAVSGSKRNATGRRESASGARNQVLSNFLA